MSYTDWAVLSLTLILIVSYGVYKSRGAQNIDGYLLGNQSMPWYSVCLSVMATQASAITFLSAPGLAYSTGMGFVQFYFGLPLAMIVLCITFVPIFHRLKVYTAYEYLEQRFDLKTRALTAFLFLIQRGLSTGITIYAPSIILSTILQINTTVTTLLIGGIVVAYTAYGGTKAVSYTQMLQMSIIFCGLFAAGIMVVHLLPADIGFSKAISIAGKMGRTEAIDFKFDLNNPYTVWSGLIGGFFLQLSYFGTDQSQVGRYLTGSSVNQSRLGLLMNGLVKIPMQFLILLIGVLVFTFYQYNKPPVFFNSFELNKLQKSAYKPELEQLEKKSDAAFESKQRELRKLNAALDKGDKQQIDEQREVLKIADERTKTIRTELTDLMHKNDPGADTNDNNYIFLSFVTSYLPQGLVGLLIAIIFLASMGSTASALNSLASTSVVDIYKRLINKNASPENYLRASRWSTLIWGGICIIMALYASKIGNLIEAVNILGSYIYGTILGVFLVAFYCKHVGGRAVFIAALAAEAIVCICGYFDQVAYLWLNVIGCVLVVGIAILLQFFMKPKETVSS
ncbi:sodium:solute symporter [Pedobacter antarcticus]|uniref:Sodium:solute symporter n=2 Tax=Pedobacter antarcticus TaxID=34086 RepID=A0A081PJB5_9SPHI|nr:sodium:solute symporter [Pedobacter antarcticus]KEQ30788.1 sodium:solute symporter [Pedobacter antarcticus 4BY]SDM41920.1 transporter, SSS family [Pedobacter antarcticus]SFE92670.1 transporter, SSS family [Pedobacter antarcticus]